MEGKRYIACINCDSYIQICGKGIGPEVAINFLGLHIHEKDEDKHLLMCFEHEYVYQSHEIEFNKKD